MIFSLYMMTTGILAEAVITVWVMLHKVQGFSLLRDVAKSAPANDGCPESKQCCSPV
jgi:hypothetical protein